MLRYKEIKQALISELLQMKADEKLPSRIELCKKLNTNRTTLDKAVKELVSEGILYSQKGSGTYIVNLIPSISSPSNSWGVIVPNVMNSIFTGLVRGVENIAHKYNINAILCNSDNETEKQKQYIGRLIASGVSGFIIVPVVSNDILENTRLYNQLISSKVPFVFCNRSVEGVTAPIVTSNDFYGGYIATKHLLAMGYQRIAYISKTRYKTSIDRCQGYLSALLENGIQINRELISIEEHSKANFYGYSSMTNMLQLEQKPDAVLCFNDSIAEGAFHAVKDAGYAISDDIGIIGYDNSDICERFEPEITSVAYKNVEIGEMAAQVLWKMTNHELISDFEYYFFQPEIIIRESCLGPKKGH
jgi:DNA-binding LacI/PurR family transcriptional regulator